jgi:hypothetical protein
VAGSVRAQKDQGVRKDTKESSFDNTGNTQGADRKHKKEKKREKILRSQEK